MTPPVTRTDAITETLHGKTIADPYRWLEDEAAPEVQAWMNEQDAYTRAALARSPARPEIEARIKQLFYFDAVSAPIRRGGRSFYTRKHVDQEKSIVYWKQGEDGEAQVLFDPNAWSADGSTGLGAWMPSWDGRYVAYQIKENNSDEAVTHIWDLSTGAEQGDVIAGTKYSNANWAPDHRGFYYTWLPPISERVSVAERPGFAEVRYHALGTPADTDAVIRPATGSAQMFIGGFVSRDGHWLVSMVQHGWLRSEVYVKDLRRGPAESQEWTTLVSGIDATFDIDVWRDHFYIKTNHDAPKNRVYRVDPANLARDRWVEIVPEREATLEHAAIVGDHLVLTYLRNAQSEIEICDLTGAPVRKVALPPLGSVGPTSGLQDEDVAYFSYSSFTEPTIIYKTTISTGETTEWAKITLPVDTSQLTGEQVFFPSKDGTKISMFLLYKQGTPRSGANPTILYGYGGFAVNLTPSFAGSRAVWLERGGVYAIPNLRGGGEYGEDWHRDGMLRNKQNVFDDFIAAAEYLIAEGWTSPAHLAISGGSNGGLLTGAVAVQRPELFKAVISAVPLLDMLRFQRSGSGQTWVPEYGSPDDPDDFAVLYAYSPYRVAVDAGKRAYPAVMFDSADHDDRVDPLHARKLAAALQAAQTAALPILLRIERNAGHGGADLVRSQVERVADQLGWLEQLLK